MSDALSQRIFRASYEGVEFPVVDLKFSSGHDKVTHGRYRGQGVVNDSTGLQAVKTQLRAAFFNNFPGWTDNLFPSRLEDLLSRLADTPVGSLHHPFYGDMQVHADSWNVDVTPEHRNGCYVDLTFEQESSDNSLISSGDGTTNEVPADPATDVLTKAVIFTSAASAAGLPFDATSIVAGPVATLQASKLSPADAGAQFAAMTAPAAAILAAYPGLAYHDLRASLDQLVASIRAFQASYAGTAAPGTYTVPTTMSLQRVAAEVYGDPSKAAKLLQANAIPDVLFVPEGTVLVVP